MVITTQGGTIAPGYKQTEVGVIPQEWAVRAVEEIAEVKSGKRLPLGKSLQDKETSHPYIRVADMFPGGVSLGNIKYVPDDVYPVIKNYRIYLDDIFISVAGSLGIVGKIPEQLDGANLTENADRLTNIRCDRDYLLYVFMSTLVQQTIESERTMGAQPKLALTRIKKFQIPLPPTRAEQRAISTALAEVDALIASLVRLIAKKRDMKTGAMQQLLTGKRRLPGFNGKWEVARLGDLAEIVMGQSPASVNYNTKGDGLPLIQGNADVENRRTTARIFTTEITKRCKAGDVIMSVRAPVGYIAKAAFDACLGRGVCALRYPNEYVYHYLISQEGSWAKLSKGSTFDSVSSSDVKAFEIHFPCDQQEQAAIATALSDMDAEIAALEGRHDKARALKQGMMQQLLTGNIRLI